MEDRFYLSPAYDSRKSFYQKAEVFREEDGTLVLYSYNTRVATVHPNTDWILHSKAAYSVTTVRHVNSFLRQFTNLNRRLTMGEIRDLIGEPQPF